MTMATGVLALLVVGTQPAQEPEAVDQRHAEIEDDGVRMTILALRAGRFLR